MYPARLDNLAKTLTFLVFIIVIIPFITIWRMYEKSHSGLLLVGPALVIIGLGLTFLFRPLGYDISADAVLIHRPVGDKKIPLSFITSCEPVQMGEFGFGLRTFAVGGYFGYFGYFGKFWYAKLGHVNYYVTDRSKLVLLRTQKDKKYFISPENREQFIVDLRARLSGK